MKKHCKKCNMNIDEVMGEWSCPMCGEELQEGYSETATSTMGEL